MHQGDLYVMHVNTSVGTEIELYVNNKNSRPVSQPWTALPPEVQELFQRQLRLRQ